MTEEKKQRLTKLHEQEDGYNKEVARINNQIKQLEIRKKKLARMISHNMKYRNKIINEPCEQLTT